MRRRLATQAALAALTGALVIACATGCTNNGITPTGARIEATEVHLLDGRTVPCVIVESNAITCDWQAAR